MSETREEFIESVKSLPQGFQDWVISLGWKQEEITSLDLHRPSYRVSVDEKGMQHFEPSSHLFVTIGRGEYPKEEDRTKSSAIFQATAEVFQLA